ncbi:unnamed protein product [Miscanthus lutarioriparius]|uniref:Fungal lipase-type domain-containing protein n=1 Tax=Miscanthus lutarioriparius TaxID=422564 RepID=A0A811Q5F2_9POAL|nr:unnamed protein product [Miscanthus lutarioriparius]
MAAASSSSISGSRTCYPSVPMARGGQRRTSGCTVIRSSLMPCSPLSTLLIGSKWAELQGARDWDGLLSPLDGALRGELVRYGEFVRAAYASFDSSYGSCRFPTYSLLHCAGMPGTGYRVTRLLHATSTSSSGWLPSPSPSPPRGSSYIGFVAVCNDEREIERLGRRDVVVAFRGTATWGEWVDNFKSGLTRLPVPTGEENGEEEAMVESGFWRLFTAPGEAARRTQQPAAAGARRGAADRPLGAALAALTAHEIATAQQRQEHAPKMMVTAVSFGRPPVGNAAFRRRLEESGSKVLRVVNSDDIVTKLPGFPVHEHDDCSEGDDEGEGAAEVARSPRWGGRTATWGASCG